MIQSPVVFLIFNRPEQTARIFAAIRAARPARLLVVADGPRLGRAGEEELCGKTRSVIDGVDWPCHVLRNFSDVNMGCGRRVSSGLDWAFAHVEEAIILEDDCLPDPNFFPYCVELLERYRADERIMMISGDNFQNGASRTPNSYYFSQLVHCWGWATWRRAWRHYDFTMSDWRQRRRTQWINAVTKNPVMGLRWRDCFDAVMAGKIDTWDYQWVYCIMARNGLSIVPDVNLVTNIGFGAGATHTLTVAQRYIVPSRAIGFPLRHPVTVEPCCEADEFEEAYLYRLSRFALLERMYLKLGAVIAPARPFLERTGLWGYLRGLAMRLRA
jgi:hypothetical protein